MARQYFGVEEGLKFFPPRFRSSGKIEIHATPRFFGNLTAYRHNMQIHFDILTNLEILTNP
jgi:hypothetical protein